MMDVKPLSVMSFNIRGAYHHSDGINSWPNRAPLNVTTIKRWAPDLIGFQELQEGNLQTYRESLTGYECVIGPKAGNRPPYEFNAIFYNPARLELRQSGGFWLSTTPERYSSSWRARVVRSANWVRFACLQSDTSFLHLNTHLDHMSRRARLEGTKLILRKIAEIQKDDDSPVLLTGDFNCSTGSSPHQVFAQAGFEDTFLAAGSEGQTEYGATFHGFGGWRRAVARSRNTLRRGAGRIDWILFRAPRPIQVKAHRVVRDRDEVSGIYPSDHYPVLARLAGVC